MNWAGLVDAAVIGTARAPAGLASGLPGPQWLGPGQVASDGISLERADDQVRLLDSAAATSRARRAGYRPPQAGERLALLPAEPDPRPEVGPAAQRRLGELLADGNHDLVAEWLRLLAVTGWRPPDALLPGLLAMATGNRVVRAGLVPVLGPLAAWLGALNAPWEWAVGSVAARAGVAQAGTVAAGVETGTAPAAEASAGGGPAGAADASAETGAGARTAEAGAGAASAEAGVIEAEAEAGAAESGAGTEAPAGAEAEAGAAEALAGRFGTGSLAARTELLARLRAHDPAIARDLLASTWASDPYRDRAALLATFATGLSLDDEPLAELGLADRRSEVRLVAADLLARMPGSRYSIKATGLVADVVWVEHKLASRHLVVDVPDDEAGELAADVPGVAELPGAAGGSAVRGPGAAGGSGAARGPGVSIPAGTGARAWLLQQLVATAPAGFWAGHTGLDPADLLALAAGTDWAGPLRDGWTRAAIRDTHAAWLIALLDHPADKRRPSEAAGLHLVAALPARERDEWLCANPGSPLFVPALESLPMPWSAPVSERVRSVLAEAALADPGYSQVPRAFLRLAALRLEPPAPPQLDPALVHDRLVRGWDDMLSTLSVRAAMRREIAEEPNP